MVRRTRRKGRQVRELDSHPCKELHEFDAYPDLIKRIENLEKNLDESQPTKLVANDTSVVKIKQTEQLPITVDINKICSVRTHDRFKQQNLDKIVEEGLEKPIVLVPNIYGHYMQIKDERKDCMQTWLKSFPFLAYAEKRNNNHRKKVKIRYDFLCNSRGHRVGEEIQGSTKLLVSKHKESDFVGHVPTFLTDKEIETLYTLNEKAEWLLLELGFRVIIQNKTL